MYRYLYKCKFSFLLTVCQSITADLYGLFSFEKNCHIHFQSGWTTLYFYQQCMGDPVSVFLPAFGDTTILCVKHSLGMCDISLCLKFAFPQWLMVLNIFSYLLAICISSSVKFQFVSFTHFLIGFFF